MNSVQHTDRNERLGAALRQGDPAGGETGLAPADAQAMRRAVLSRVAEPEPRRSFRLAPAFAAAAVAVLSTLVALSLWRMHGPEPGQPVSPAVPASPIAPAPAVPSPALSPDVVAVVSPPPPVHAVRRRERRPRIAETPAVPSPAPEPAPMRQVQFSAPGGTRIIWLLPTR